MDQRNFYQPYLGRSNLPLSFSGNNVDVLTSNIKSSSPKCTCFQDVEWVWDSETKCRYVDIVNNNKDVKFHRNFSNGTALVRGSEAMSNNQYYWEVKITTPVYGTDIMIGVGTTEVEIKHENKFLSLLGMDNKTWGLSYTGLFHHSGQQRLYAPCFGQGSIIGVHLDLWRGQLSFYKDRRHLGVASTGLKGKTLYAMASSTAAGSGMRIIRSCSFPSSLQFLCCSKLRELIPDDTNVLDVINVPPGLKHYLSNNLSWLLDKRSMDNKVHICCNSDYPSSEIRTTIADESATGSVINSSEASSTSPFDPYSMAGRFILLGSVLLSNYNHGAHSNQSQSSDDKENSPKNAAKRPRCS